MNKTILLVKVINLLSESGFTPGDQVKDLGSVILGCTYVVRNQPGRHEFVSVCSYKGEFCEVVYFRYNAPKNTKKPPLPPAKMSADALAAYEKDLIAKGFSPSKIGLLRSIEELKAVL